MTLTCLVLSAATAAPPPPPPPANFMQECQEFLVSERHLALRRTSHLMCLLTRQVGG